MNASVATPVAAIPLHRWSKDHWSLLAYIETLCVDGKQGVGTLDLRRVRCNPAAHPTQDVNRQAWKPSYGSRLRGYFEFDQRTDAAAAEKAGLQLPDHDDWACLDDLEEAGLIDVLSFTSGFVRLTEPGLRLSGELRQHKATGGMFATFTPASMLQAEPV